MHTPDAADATTPILRRVDVTISIAVSDAGDGSPHVEGDVGPVTARIHDSTTDRAGVVHFEGWMELLATLESIASEHIER